MASNTYKSVFDSLVNYMKAGKYNRSFRNNPVTRYAYHHPVKAVGKAMIIPSTFGLGYLGGKMILNIPLGPKNIAAPTQALILQHIKNHKGLTQSQKDKKMSILNNDFTMDKAWAWMKLNPWLTGILALSAGGLLGAGIYGMTKKTNELLLLELLQEDYYRSKYGK